MNMDVEVIVGIVRGGLIGRRWMIVIVKRKRRRKFRGKRVRELRRKKNLVNLRRILVVIK